MTYNGWPNHATWLMSLYLNGSYGYIADHAREDRIASAAALGADRLRALVTEEVTIYNPHSYGAREHAIVNFQNECIGTALNDADWGRLAEAFAPAS